MEIDRFDLQPASEDQRDRIVRATRYLGQTASDIVKPERPDYVEDLGRYFLSLAAVAEETGRPVDRRNVIEISKSAMELTDMALHDRASRVQADVAGRTEEIKRLVFAHLEPATRLANETGPASYLEILDMLASGDVSYTPILRRQS